MSMNIQPNPLHLPLPEVLKAEPCILVIFGASGDLTKRKLVPALYDLAHDGNLPPDVTVLGLGQDSMSEEEFREQMRMGVSHARPSGEVIQEEWAAFASKLFYATGDLKDSATYKDLAVRLERMKDRDGASANHLFYCATPPSLAPSIVDGLGHAGLAAEQHGWSRMIIEKPFGRDLDSANALNETIAAVFSEHQVFRIDHYLGKETVQNLLVFRFGNALFEPVWNRNYVDYIEITAAETLGIGHRAGYYEEAGAVRDMVANHLLQLLALTAMEPPLAFEANAVRDEKVRVWRAMHPMTPEEVAARTVRGQYGPGVVDGQSVPGYREEQGISPDSSIETYAAIEFRIENWRWAGVPFYVRTGKRLGGSLTEITIHLKRTPQALFSRTPDDHVEPNVIAMRIQPNESITVSFGAKRPGAVMRTETVNMDFCYQTAFSARLPAAYETLLLDVMRGDPTLFTRRDGVEAQWKLITPIEEAWSQQTPPEFPNYAAGSDGPAAADELLARNGHRWTRLSQDP